MNMEWRRLGQPHPGTRVDNYRCSLPGLAGFAIYRCGGTARATMTVCKGLHSARIVPKSIAPCKQSTACALTYML